MPNLFFDTTKTRRHEHLSGLNRVSARLQEALRKRPGIALVPVRWSIIRRSYVAVESGRPVGKGNSRDAFFTPEVFALKERPFCRRWLEQFKGPTATLFYDAIPYVHPEITWPHSVRRFPKWYADLQAYRHVSFISEHSREEARQVHAETGLPLVEGPVLGMGSNYMDKPPEKAASPEPILLNVGILEPRKGQDCLLRACEALWMEGFAFKLVFLGRVNPHYGKPLLEKIELLQQAGQLVVHENQVGDDRLAHWHGRASLVVQPSRAEGYGLPVLEALWAGCPVLASSQPSLDDVPGRKGIRELPEVSAEALESALKELLEDSARLQTLQREVPETGLPTWDTAAGQLLQQLGLPDNS